MFECSAHLKMFDCMQCKRYFLKTYIIFSNGKRGKPSALVGYCSHTNYCKTLAEQESNLGYKAHTDTGTSTAMISNVCSEIHLIS